MSKNYDKEIRLVCPTCGGQFSFETDPQTGVIVCHKCNRVFYGGYDELVKFNERRISDEIELTKNEVKKDIEKKNIRKL
jgi:transcription initiation factor TFIIIB Brf1 subunit/transcription initiation factor TFIIB